MSFWASFFADWQPSDDALAEHLRVPRFHRPRLERFPRGIDNDHIDVALDEEFVLSAGHWVRTVLREDVYRHFWNDPPKVPEIESGEVFRRTYVELTREVVKQARAMARPERVQLYQLAVLRLLVILIDQELQALRHELDDAQAHPMRQQSGQRLQLHDRKVVLSRYAPSIRFRAAGSVLRTLNRLEFSSLRKLRKSILGTSWPLSAELFGNPLLALGGLGAADDFLTQYPMALSRERTAHALCESVMRLLQPWLPQGVGVSSARPEDLQVRMRRDQGGLRGYVEIEQRLAQLVSEDELRLAGPHRFDNAAGVASLLGGEEADWPDSGPWAGPQVVRTQRRLIQRFKRELRQAGLFREVFASYLLQTVYPQLGVRDVADAAYDYLAEKIRRKELVRRLSGLPQVDDAEQLARRLDALVKVQRRTLERRSEQMLVRFVADCLRFRYHLKLAWWSYRGMDGLRLLTDHDEREMSQLNGLLQLFARENAGYEGDHPVIGHVIIKADVRGSTEITSQMRARNLNPAAYFSRNLYAPITMLLKPFGAEKVFVEGDAVILAILEYGQARRQHLAVARACGLAQRILEVVQSKNAESRRLGLPQLELGLGIAYSSDAPTCLYDEGHKIMISSAINRADRLSSCDAPLRALHAKRGEVEHGVDVVARPGAVGRNELELLRFNINGIELERAAFYQLVEELKMRRVRLPDQRGEFLVGRYPDARGVAHWLVLREAPVRLLLGTQLLDESPEGQSFYQVVTDRELRADLQRMVGQPADRPAQQRA
jgi:hypothetical protein